jgi:hypothetical protein
MTELFVGILIGVVVGVLATIVGYETRKNTSQQKSVDADDIMPEVYGPASVHGWERSVRALRSRQQSNNQ